MPSSLLSVLIGLLPLLLIGLLYVPPTAGFSGRQPPWFLPHRCDDPPDGWTPDLYYSC